MEQFQSLLAQNTTSGSGTALVKMPDGTVRRYPVGSIPDNATPMSVDGQQIRVAPQTRVDPTTGTNIGVNAPTGANRVFAGIKDIFTGGDADQRGHGGGRVSDEGYGGPGSEYEIKKPGDKPTLKLPKKKTDIEESIGKTWDQYMEGNKALMLEVGKAKFEQEQMARLPDLMHAAFGGSYATAAAPGNANLAQIASNSRAYQFGGVNIPTRTNFASLLG